MEKIALKEKIKELLQDKVIEECSFSQGDYMNTVFLREKKLNNTNERKFRIILNMKILNKDFVKKEHHKMDSLNTCLCLMKENCFMASIDLKNAFHTFPMHPEFTKYLKFKVEDICYKYLVLPMGFTDSPRIFCKLLKPVVSHLRKQGFLSSLYIDDFYLQGSSYEECERNVTSTFKLLKKLGFEISDKSMMQPTKNLEHLGFILNSTDMSISLSEEKRNNIILLLSDSLKKQLSARDIAKITGTLVATFPAVEYGRLYYRDLEMLKIQSLKPFFNFDNKATLNSACIKEIKWWLEEGLFSSNVISHKNPDFILQSDSSGFAWGALLLGEQVSTQGFWDSDEKLQDINILELKASKLGVQALCQDLNNCHLQLQIDNTTAVTYINNMGGTHSLECNKQAKELILWCKNKNIWLTACHIAGKDNTEADFLSRKINDNIEWSLKQEAFEFICSKFGKPTIDLFASRINHKLEKYISLLPDINATAINAFHHKWSEFAYLFPPFNLIPRVLKKIREDKTPAAILIFPQWECASWYPVILTMSLRDPLFLRQSEDLLFLHHKKTAIHPLMPKLKLMAGLLSGTNSKEKDLTIN